MKLTAKAKLLDNLRAQVARLKLEIAAELGLGDEPPARVKRKYTKRATKGAPAAAKAGPRKRRGNLSPGIIKKIAEHMAANVGPTESAKRLGLNVGTVTNRRYLLKHTKPEKEKAAA